MVLPPQPVLLPTSSPRFPTGTRQRCEAELAKLDKQISRKERELEGVNRQLEEATARQGGWRYVGCFGVGVLRRRCEKGGRGAAWVQSGWRGEWEAGGQWARQGPLLQARELLSLPWPWPALPCRRAGGRAGGQAAPPHSALREVGAGAAGGSGCRQQGAVGRTMVCTPTHTHGMQFALMQSMPARSLACCTLCHLRPCPPLPTFLFCSSAARRSGMSGAARRRSSCAPRWLRSRRTSGGRRSSWRRRRPMRRRWAGLDVILLLQGGVWVGNGRTSRANARPLVQVPNHAAVAPSLLIQLPPLGVLPGGGARGRAAPVAGGAGGERQDLAGAAGEGSCCLAPVLCLHPARHFTQDLVQASSSSSSSNSNSSTSSSSYVPHVAGA